MFYCPSYTAVILGGTSKRQCLWSKFATSLLLSLIYYFHGYLHFNWKYEHFIASKHCMKCVSLVYYLWWYYLLPLTSLEMVSSLRLNFHWHLVTHEAPGDSDSELSSLFSLYLWLAIIGCNWPGFLSLARNVPDIYCRLVTQTPAPALGSRHRRAKLSCPDPRCHKKGFTLIKM